MKKEIIAPYQSPQAMAIEIEVDQSCLQSSPEFSDSVKLPFSGFGGEGGEDGEISLED